MDATKTKVTFPLHRVLLLSSHKENNIYLNKNVKSINKYIDPTIQNIIQMFWINSDPSVKRVVYVIFFYFTIFNWIQKD